MYFHSLLSEIALVFGHDVACSQLACVQILGLPDDLQPASLKLFQAKEKQIVIVGLELEHTAGNEQLALLFKEPAMSKAMLFVAALGPRVTEIEINGVKTMVK